MEYRNSWEAGRNTDISPQKLPNNQYYSAHNVELTGDSAFSNLRNVLGTTHVANVFNSPLTEVLGVFKNRYLISGERRDCLTIFTATPNVNFAIHCYDTENNVVYQLFEEVLTDDYFINVVDAVSYPENGVDISYFTDFFNEIRYLRCEIPDSYSPNFLNSYTISLLRRGANGTVAASVSTGGTLLSGTYQFSYRSCDPERKAFTKWSSPTNPIHVYDKANSNSPVYSGVGLVTDRKITLTVTPSSEELTGFSFIQLAVIENVGTTSPITASLLEIESLSGSSVQVEYKSNSRIGTIPLEDITVDLAQIDTVKTLNVKENRLFLGNIQYKNLEFDNGTPSIGGGSVLRQASATVDSFSGDDFASNYRGYWRGEVYRFGIVYYDEFGNKSAVQPLDLSTVTGNQISGAVDMKFPDRSTSSSYTLFNSSGRIQSLGLSLTGLTNHPTWARAFEIVRVKRTGKFKDIQFQSPLIPLVQVEGTGAIDSYPTESIEGGGDNGTTRSQVENDNAQPMTNGSTFIAKNLFWPEARAIVRRRENEGEGTGLKKKGEVRYEYIGESLQCAMVFPPGTMYTADGKNSVDPFKFTGSEEVDFVDYALLKVNTQDHTGISIDDGDDVATNISGNFYANQNNEYYFDSSWAAKSIPSTYQDLKINNYAQFDNLGKSASIGGDSIFDYTALETQGVELGYPPTIQKSAVIRFQSNVYDINTSSKVFAAGTLNSYNPGGYLVGSSGIKYQTNLSNLYCNEYSGFISSTAYVNAVGIVNVKLGLGDDRYGDLTTFHEYISTGAKYTFSSSEIATLEAGGSVSKDIDVWGGDCFVGPQIFKISDSSYSIVNQSKNYGGAQTQEELWRKWQNKFFLNSGGSAISLPVPLKGVGQFVQVIIESEYSEVREADLLTSNTSNELPIFNVSTSAGIRSPLTYRYNPNLNQQNDQKIFVPDPEFSFKQSDFGSRIAYSDLKIYNSDQAGFDVFRVSNYYDLEEKYHDITKLALAGDNLYAIQEQGVTYIPTGERQIESTDGGTLAVRSGDVIGRPVIIDSTRGSQHLRGIVETGGVIYIPDNRNKNVYALSGQELRPITKDNETAFRTSFATQADEKYVIGIYDPVKRQYWLINGNAEVEDQYCDVFNEQIGNWVANFELAGNCKGGVYTNQNLYLVGVVSDTGDPGIYNCSIHTMYTGGPSRFFGFNKQARVEYSVNPFMDYAKKFDNTMIAASDRLSSIEFVVPNESMFGNQTASASLDIETKQNSYRIANPRAAGSARLQGLYCMTRLNWKNDNQSEVNSANTKVRLVPRRPW